MNKYIIFSLCLVVISSCSWNMDSPKNTNTDTNTAPITDSAPAV